MLFLDLVGVRFGRLVGSERVGKRAGATLWRCMCDCGKTALVTVQCLRSGKTKSCGCLSAEISGQRMRTHGMSNTATYNVWQVMIGRCSRETSDKKGRYKARGIVVCDHWKASFDHFHADMGDRPSLTHSIDRIDNNKGYCPENCRWVTSKEQARNRTSNRAITHNGTTLLLCEWAEKSGLKTGTLWRRLKQGVPFEVAIALPPQRIRRYFSRNY